MKQTTVPCVHRRNLLVAMLSTTAIALTINVAPIASAHAQTPAAQSLPTVNVQAPRQARPRPAARPRQTARRAAPRTAPRAPVAPVVATAPAETATGPVRGYIANQSASGTKTDTPLRETPQSITVVSAERASDQGALNVSEAFRYVPGVNAEAYGPDSRGDFPRIRGQDPNIFLDGMQIANTFQFNEWRPDPYMLSRFEVLRGPPSMLYGASTVSGLINLVSKRPQEEAFREIGFSYGTFDRKQVFTDMTGKATEDGKWLYRFVGIFRDSDYQTDFVKDNRTLIAPSVTWKPTENTNWTLMGVYQRDATGSSSAFLPHSGTILPNPNGPIPFHRFVGEPGFDRYVTTTAAVTSIFEHRFTDWLKFTQSTRYANVEGTYNTAYPNIYFDIGSPTFPFADPNMRTITRIFSASETSKNILTTDNNFEAKFTTGPIQHRMLFGVDYRSTDEKRSDGMGLDPREVFLGQTFDLYAPRYLGALAPEQWFNPLSADGTGRLVAQPKTQQTQTGVYVQDQMRLGRWIGLFGARHDWATNSTAGTPTEHLKATTGRAALMYEFDGGFSPYVSYATSFNPILGSRCVTGICRPQEGESVEVGFKYNPMRSLVINAALFDTTEKNRISFSDSPDPTLATQTGKVRLRGGEIEVLARLWDDFDLVAGYSYTDAKVVAGDNAGTRVEAVPFHQASLWGKYRLNSFGLPGLTVGAGVRFVGESYDGSDNPLLTTPSYTLFDAMVRYETGPWRAQLNVNNIADTQYFSTCLARGDCFLGTRRTIVGTLAYRF